MKTRNHLLSALGATLMLSSALATSAIADEVTFWTPEEQPERLAVQEELAAEFAKKTGHTVKVVPVTESEMGKRITAAFAAGGLPDVVYHSVQNVLPWSEAGILDVDTNNEIVEELGVETFAAAPLSIAKTEDGYAAVPVDGWTQLLVYRKDLFDEAGLEAPTTFEAIKAAVEKLHNPPEVYAFNAPNKIDENYMMQVLEHLMLANGYSPVGDASAEKLKQVLELYKTIAKASPPGERYWQQSREDYFAGKAAMVIWSPFILDEMAGLRDSAPPTINDDPTSVDLAKKTGIVTKLAGPNHADGAGWADTRYMSVTNDADTDASAEFIRFMMSDGYTKMLSMAPEGKFPVRQGDGEDDQKFVKAWSELPVGVDRKAPLAEIYPQEVIDDIVGGLANGDRWGLKENQLARASKIISNQVYNQVFREFLDDKITADEAVEKINAEIAKIE